MKCNTVTLLLTSPSLFQSRADGAKLALYEGMKTPTLRPLRLLLISSLLSIAPQAAYPADVNSNADAPASQPDIQPLDSIRLAVQSFIESVSSAEGEIDVAVKQLDRRLRLAYCTDPLTTTWSPGSRAVGRVTVQVACSAPRPWRVHVQATVTMQGLVWTLSRGVSRGDILTRDVLSQQSVTLGANNAAFTSLGTPVRSIDMWLGYEFAQRVNSGKVLNERMLKPARLLYKGDTVVIRHRSQGLELQTKGVALSDAGARQQTQVRNSSSGKIIDVVVVSTGIVEILQ